MKTRSFLEAVQDIRDYSFSTLGLKEQSFSRFKELTKLSCRCCPSLRFHIFYSLYVEIPDFWVNALQGFLQKKGCEKEAKRLKGLGYDVIIRKADYFSTLGFFSDPIYCFLYPTLC